MKLYRNEMSLLRFTIRSFYPICSTRFFIPVSFSPPLLRLCPIFSSVFPPLFATARYRQRLARCGYSCSCRLNLTRRRSRECSRGIELVGAECTKTRETTWDFRCSFLPYYFSRTPQNDSRPHRYFRLSHTPVSLLNIARLSPCNFPCLYEKFYYVFSR